jgi:hypothetical protein
VKTILNILMISILLVGCKEDKGHNDKPVNTLKGSMSGFVVLVDSMGLKENDNSGATIVIDGTNYWTVSDSIGKWSIKDVPAGIYDIIISKPGYSTYKIKHPFVGGGDDFLYKFRISKLPTYHISDIFVGLTSNNQNVTINANLSSQSNESVMIFFNHASTVSSDPTDYIGFTSANSTVNGSINSISYILNPTQWRNMGVSSGEKIYYRIYPNTKNGYNSYVDPETGKEIFLSLGSEPSNIDSLIVP